nr:immunoglobulin light chain junction region [Macaca mulatta]
CQQYADLPRTF